MQKASAKNSQGHYILRKILQHQGRTSFDIASPDVQLEHVLPKEWEENWRGVDFLVKEGTPPEERQLTETIWSDYFFRLGNHTLLFDSRNVEISNDAFDSKKEKYEQDNIGITHSPQNSTQLSITFFDEWTSESIEKRQLEIAKLANEIWKM